MRWFKHLAAAHKDKGLTAIEEEMGVMGAMAYGVYWHILELVADAAKADTPKLARSNKWWASACHCSGKLFTEIAERLAAVDLIVLKRIGTQVEIEVPGLVIRQDDGRLSPSVWANVRRAIFERDNYTCRYCGKPALSPQCDHVHPVSRGGSNGSDNLATACISCNQSKGSKTVEEWLQ